MQETGKLEDNFASDNPIRTLLQIYAKDKRNLSLSILFYFLKTSPVWVMPIAFANIITIISKPSVYPLKDIWINGAVALFTILINSPLHVLYIRCMSLTVRDAEKSLRSAICRHLQMVTISFYRHMSSGAIQSKALRDVETIDQMVRGLYDNGLGAIGSIAVAIGYTAIRAPYFLPLYLLTVPPVIILRIMLGKKLTEANSEFRSEFEGMSSRITSMIDMIPVARAHAVEDLEMDKIDRKLDRVKAVGKKVDLRNGIFGSFAWVFFQVLNLSGYVVAGWCSYKKIMPLTPGDVILLGTYFSAISNSVTGLVNMLPAITKGFEAVRSIGDILESPDVEINRGKPPLQTVDGTITFDNVVFNYPGAARPAINGLKLRVKSGSTVAFVGPSGSGKSTLMGLILGFNRPNSGRILVDSKDMNDFDMRSFRESVAVVSQETILFQGTIRENILYGTKNVSEDDLTQALRDANAYHFIEDMPEGLDTMLGERGARLSGGQKQRIAIARAIIRRPRVLILDEATSALDVEAEFVVQEALDRLMKGRTTFIVAHRLSTIRNADLIVLLDNGKVGEMGTHSELIDHNRAFASMYNLQVTGGRAYAQ